MSLSRELISLIRAKTMSAEDLHAAALYMLDAIATAYAGSRTATGKRLLKWARSTGQDSGRQAFLMGALTHITETDDLHRASVTHPGCVVVPAALAIGTQRGCSGEKILQAVLHGFEAMCRVGAAVGPAHYRIWHNTATCGPFGSAMAAAHLLDLDVEQTVNALGNAGTQSCGLWQFMETGAMSKHLHAGRAAESGLLAAELATHGFTGPPQILEGSQGIFTAMCPDALPQAVTADPDAPWQLRQTSIKPWPSCRHTHPAIDAALDIHPRLNDSTVEHVDVETYQAALDVCDRPDPDNEYQAKFSLHHCVAMALLHGEVTLDSFTPQARAESASLRAITRLQVAEPFAANYPQAWGARVRVNTTAGHLIEAARKDCKGDPELALSTTEMRAKVVGLMQYGGLSIVQAHAVCDSILALPEILEIPRILSDYWAAIGIYDNC